MKESPVPYSSLCSEALAEVENYCICLGQCLAEEPVQIELFLNKITPALCSALNLLGQRDSEQLWQLYLTSSQLVNSEGNIESILINPGAPLENPASRDPNFVEQFTRSALHFSTRGSIQEYSKQSNLQLAKTSLIVLAFIPLFLCYAKRQIANQGEEFSIRGLRSFLAKSSRVNSRSQKKINWRFYLAASSLIFGILCLAVIHKDRNSAVEDGTKTAGQNYYSDAPSQPVTKEFAKEREQEPILQARAKFRSPGATYRQELPSGVVAEIEVASPEENLLSLASSLTVPLTRNSWIDLEQFDSHFELTELEQSTLVRLSKIAEIMKSYPKVALEFQVGEYQVGGAYGQASKSAKQRVEKILLFLESKGIASSRLAVSKDYFLTGDRLRIRFRLTSR